MHRELKRKHVTLSIIWEEYIADQVAAQSSLTRSPGVSTPYLPPMPGFTLITTLLASVLASVRGDNLQCGSAKKAGIFLPITRFDLPLRGIPLLMAGRAQFS